MKLDENIQCFTVKAREIKKNRRWRVVDEQAVMVQGPDLFPINALISQGVYKEKNKEKKKE